MTTTAAKSRATRAPRTIVNITPRLRAYRWRNHLTQQQLADQMGIARTTVAWLESHTSTKKPGRRLAEAIATITGCSVGSVVDEYERIRDRK